MGKYTGYKVFEKNNLISGKKDEIPNGRKTTLCGNIKSLENFLNANYIYTNFDKKYLAELFVSIKMLYLINDYHNDNLNIIQKYANDNRLNEKQVDRLMNGESLDFIDLEKDGVFIEDEQLQNDIKTIQVNNERFSQFKKDLKEIHPEENRIDRFQDEIVTIFYNLGFKKKDFESFEDSSYLKDKTLNKLDDETKKRYDEDFSNFMNKFEEIKLNKQKDILNSAERKDDSTLKEEFEHSYNYFYNASRKISGIESKASESDLLVNAVSANMEMKKRMTNSTLKKIPLLRWLSKEFRKENKLYKESREVIENLQSTHNITELIDNGAPIDDIFNEIKEVQIEANLGKNDPFVVKENTNDKKQVFENDPDKEININPNLISNKVEINLEKSEKDISKN